MRTTQRPLSPAGLLAVPLLLAAHASAGEEWRDLKPLPRPRQEVGVAEAGGKIYVIGGILADATASDLADRYDPATDTWEPLPPLPRKLHHIGAASLAGLVYTAGGLDGGFNGVTSCFVFDPSRGAWDPLDPLPTARGAMGVAVIEGKLFAAGGQRTGGTVAEFAAFTPGPDGGSWETLPAMSTPRNHLAAAAVGGYFFAISGRGGGLRPEVERYDPEARRWSPRQRILTPRGGIAAAVLGGRIYVFGGEGNRNDPSGVFPQTEMYDPALDRWFPRLAMSVPRHGIGAAAVGGAIYIPGGSEVEGFGVSAANTAYLPPEDGTAAFIRGDANGDRARDISDAIAILFSLFLGGPRPPCPDAGDSNDDGAVDVSDAVHLLEYLFLDGAEPPPPGPLPGADPTPDPLDCS